MSTAATNLAVSYTEGRKNGAPLRFITIHPVGRYCDGERREVSGKAEARKIAKSLGATPWNF